MVCLALGLTTSWGNNELESGFWNYRNSLRRLHDRGGRPGGVCLGLDHYLLTTAHR